ncbi:MAG: heme ABC exporter ATP-binding protein CcmA [Proteobacteria bacterium]|nr:heme ABC exporter ATP-binding protein CcmA [Pseudomonadota bacterium]
MLSGKNISYARGVSSLFNDISFTLKKEQMIIVRGKNGSGKSTLLRLLAGLIRPQPQMLFWKEEEITSNNLSTYQQNLLYFGHRLALHPEALVKDQMRLWQDIYGISEKVIGEALEIWDVSRLISQKIAHLSQGQQKRLSLSRCSWLDRPLWILDEPQAGLDQEGRVALTKILQEHLKRGGMVIQATHEEDTAPDGIWL